MIFINSQQFIKQSQNMFPLNYSLASLKFDIDKGKFDPFLRCWDYENAQALSWFYALDEAYRDSLIFKLQKLKKKSESEADKQFINDCYQYLQRRRNQEMFPQSYSLASLQLDIDNGKLGPFLVCWEQKNAQALSWFYALSQTYRDSLILKLQNLGQEHESEADKQLINDCYQYLQRRKNDNQNEMQKEIKEIHSRIPEILKKLEAALAELDQIKLKILQNLDKESEIIIGFIFSIIGIFVSIGSIIGFYKSQTNQAAIIYGVIGGLSALMVGAFVIYSIRAKCAKKQSAESLKKKGTGN